MSNRNKFVKVIQCLVTAVTLVPTVNNHNRMAFKKISDDLKEAALRLRLRGRDTDDEICDITGFSKKTLRRAQAQKNLTGSVTAHKPIG